MSYAILVISLAGAGDTLMATPFLSELRLAFPDAKIDVLTMQGAVARDILQGNPNVSAHLHHDFMHESKISTMRFCMALRKRRYDLSFTMMPQNRFEYNAVTWLIGAKQRLGFDYRIHCGAMGRFLLTKQIAEKEIHLSDNNLRLLSEGLGVTLSGKNHKLELFPSESDRCIAERFLFEHGLSGKRLIGLHPGSGTTKNLILKRWPQEKWSSLIDLIRPDDHSAILLFGGPEEEALRAAIAGDASVPPERILDAGNLPMLAVASLMSHLNAFVCNDALLTHIAAAMNVPTVVVQGPLFPWSTAPYRCPDAQIVRLDLACSPCYGYSKYGIKCTNERPMQCLEAIMPEQVHASLSKLLGR